MRGLIAIARREIVARRSVLAAAAAASLVPLAVPIARGLSGHTATDVRTSIAFILSIAFALGLSSGLGVSMLPPAIASRRIGFDLARPVSTLAVWFGCLFAALALALSTAVLVWVPSLLAGARVPWGDLANAVDLPRLWPVLLPALLAVVFAACHALAIMFRSRSIWLLLDLVLALAASALFAAGTARLPPFIALRPLMRSVIGFSIVAALAIIAGSYASLARGRTDIRAAHRALSVTLWVLVAIGLAGVHGYAAWVMSAGPQDLSSEVWADPAARGTWMVLQGQARGARATFLFDATTRRFERLLVTDFAGPALSLDGRHAAWVDGRNDGGPFEILTMDLDGKTNRARTRIVLPGYPALLVLSEDGSRLATVEEGNLAIHDLKRGRTLASARIGSGYPRGVFVGPDRFRVYRQATPEPATTRLEIIELDAATRTLEPAGRADFAAGSIYYVASPDAERLAVLHIPTKEVWLLDGKTGAVVSKLADRAPGAGRWPGFLSDGTVVISERLAGADRHLRVFTRDGREIPRIPLPAGDWARLGGEIAPGRLILGVGGDGTESSHLVDVPGRSVRKIADGLGPVVRLSAFSWQANWSAAPGSEATKLFYGAQRHSLVRLDLATGDRRVILGEGIR